MQTELATLKTSIVEREVDELVAAALDDGRLHKAQEDWARGLGKANVASLKEFLGKAQPIPKDFQSGGKPPAGDDPSGLPRR